MAEDNRQIEGEEDQDVRRTGRDSMRRRSVANARARQKRSGPAKFNGIHRRRSKRVSW